MGSTVGHAIATGTRRLAQLPGVVPRLEAERLLALVTGLTRCQILARPERPLSGVELEDYVRLVERRAAGEPFAYLCGSQPFWNLEIQVTPATLIPRPETELLVELTLASLPADEPLRIADLGTGSGALAVALAAERPHWQLVATDRSRAALAVARGNLARLGLANVQLLAGSWLAPFGPASFDAVLSNPPYVRDGDPHLVSDGLSYEPATALVAGADGLAAIRPIVATARTALSAGGLLAIEHGADQGDVVGELLAEVGYVDIGRRKDLAGHERVSYARTPKTVRS